MLVLELFAGTCSFAKVARGRGHDAFTTDFDPRFDVDWVGDIMAFDPKARLRRPPDAIWASPPCESFSIAAVSSNWDKSTGEFVPTSHRSVLGRQIAIRTLEVIDQCCRWASETGQHEPSWFIENPVGVLRKMPFMIPAQSGNAIRHTVTYCQYGDRRRRKPTDIWTNNFDWLPRPPCHNGDPCHEAAPRGSKTGTQGLKNATERATVPPMLCEEIIRACEESHGSH